MSIDVSAALHSSNIQKFVHEQAVIMQAGNDTGAAGDYGDYGDYGHGIGW